MCDTAQKSGSDAAIIRIHNSNRGLAMTTDCTPRYVVMSAETIRL